VKIVVIGGGPAGIMAAIRASQLKQDVTLVEKNPTLGKKLLLSGKGRCNLTNLCELDLFLKRFSKNGQFLRDAFKKFFNQDLINFFEKRGLMLKVERQQRVFPVTDKAVSVMEALKKELLANKVKIIYRAQLKDIVIQDNRVKGSILSDGRFLAADRIILATGGISYGFTGSTGQGLGIAKKLGHTITPLRAGLVPLETRQKFPKLLEGLTLKNIRLKFSDGEKEIISETGELLFTDFGISGPLVLTLSGQIVDWVNEAKYLYVEIDLKPALTKEQLNARLLREFKLNSKKTIKNTLKNILPQRLIAIFLEIAKINPDKKVSFITLAERQNFISLLKSFRLDILRPRPIEQAMLTRGGISLKEINPRTMESRLIKGLYFAGEMIDVDADTGGFNLQAAFSTGYLAGESTALS
jgi:predicted Rossmann fold flavoprotein